VSGASGSVLVIDDEPVVRDVLGRYFMREGFSVLEAADGENALAAIRDQSPRAVVLDLMLPRLSGLDVLRLVRLETDVPVVILSARASEPERIAGLRLGADDYVVKPYSPR
jgi:two-component system, OmpR family, phosphate regulon response regulator PhoB